MLPSYPSSNTKQKTHLGRKHKKCVKREKTAELCRDDKQKRKFMFDEDDLNYCAFVVE